MSEFNMTQLDQDIDTLRDVYMTNSQREALARVQALASDHARLQADAAKRATGQPLCDLCQQREEVRSDAEGIPFCQECWDGWQAEEAKAAQP